MHYTYWINRATDYTTGFYGRKEKRQWLSMGWLCRKWGVGVLAYLWIYIRAQWPTSRHLISPSFQVVLPREFDQIRFDAERICSRVIRKERNADISFEVNDIIDAIDVMITLQERPNSRRGLWLEPTIAHQTTSWGRRPLIERSTTPIVGSVCLWDPILLNIKKKRKTSITWSTTYGSQTKRSRLEVLRSHKVTEIETLQNRCKISKMHHSSLCIGTSSRTEAGQSERRRTNHKAELLSDHERLFYCPHRFDTPQ